MAGAYTTLDELVRLKGRAAAFSLLPRQPVHSPLAGRRASRLRGRGLDFEEIRKYLPGDDIRQIDWKVTARTRKAHVRVYSEERERPVVLVVDQRLSMFFGSRRNMKSVTACEAAALAAWSAVAAQDRVGAVAFSDDGLWEARPQRSRASVMRILKKLLDMNQALKAGSPAPGNRAMLDESLRRARQVTPHDGLLIVITDGAGGDDETRRLVTEIARHNDVLVAFVFDPLEGELPDIPRLVVSDGGRQLEIDAEKASLRSRFHDEFLAHRQEAKHFLLTREAPVMPLSAAEDTADQVARQLGRVRRPA